MAHQDNVQYYFGESQRKIVYENLSKIIEILSSQRDSVSLYVHEVDILDIPKKRNNPTYLDDELLRFTETGISILDITPEITELLRPYIPRNVKELMLPSTFFKDITFLDEFPNVESLIIPDYASFTQEEMDYIVNNTNIKTIEFRSTNAIKSLENKPGFCSITAGNTIAKYDRLLLFNQGYQGKWTTSLTAKAKECSEENIATLDYLYERIKDVLPPLHAAALIVDKEEKFSIEIEEGVVECLKAEHVTPTEFASVYKRMNKRTPIASGLFVTENITHQDIEQLEEVNATTNLNVNYRSPDKTSYVTATCDEFINMRSTIDYYKSLIEGSNLSPIEQIAYVYDILKTMQYHENQEDKNRSRNLHTIITDGNIVCQGYASFAKQLLSELGIKCVNVGVTCLRENKDPDFHARNFVRVDDDKYNIHGIFSLDVTWDSDKDVALIEENGEKIIIQHPELTDKVLHQYDSLVLYRHFLTPMSDYESRYPEELPATLYTTYKQGKVAELVEESKLVSVGKLKTADSNNSVALPQHMELFEPNEDEYIVQTYLEAPKPSLETFKEILSTVRKAEGYTERETKEEVDRVVELHNMLNEQNPNSKNHFFKPSTK